MILEANGKKNAAKIWNVKTMKSLRVKQHTGLKTNKYIKWTEAKLMLFEQEFKH